MVRILIATSICLAFVAVLTGTALVRASVVPPQLWNLSLCAGDGSKEYCATAPEATQSFSPCRKISNETICELSLRLVPVPTLPFFSMISFSRRDRNDLRNCWAFRMEMPDELSTLRDNTRFCYFAKFPNNSTSSSCVPPNAWTREHCFRCNDPDFHNKVYFQVSPRYVDLDDLTEHPEVY